MYKHTSMLVFLLLNSGYGKFSFGLGNWEVLRYQQFLNYLHSYFSWLYQIIAITPNGFCLSQHIFRSNLKSKTIRNKTQFSTFKSPVYSFGLRESIVFSLLEKHVFNNVKCQYNSIFPDLVKLI